MYIGTIKNLSNDFNSNISLQNDKSTKNTDPFSKFFDQAMNLISVTNDLQLQAEQQQVDFITGKSDDIIALSMANSRANSAIQFTSQVTNKILTAYQEIMRISI